MPTPRKPAKSAEKSSAKSSKPAARRSPAKSAAKKRGAATKRGASSSRSRAAQSRGSASKSAGARGNRAPNALELLTADHREAQKNFRKGERMDSGDARLQELVRATCAALTLHAQIEEEIFYPALRAQGDNEDLLEEATVEHDVAKDLIAQLEAMTAGDERFKATFKVLGEYVNHHIEEEESRMFRAAKRAKLDLVALGEEIMAAKQGGTATASDRTATAGRSARGGSQSKGSRTNGAERDSRRAGAPAAEAPDESDDESMLVGSTSGDTGEDTERPGRGGRSLSAIGDSGDDTEIDVETPGGREDRTRRQAH